jgi:hypothetical protein
MLGNVAESLDEGVFIQAVDLVERDGELGHDCRREVGVRRRFF